MKPTFTLKFGVGGVTTKKDGKIVPATSNTVVPEISAFRNSLPFSENMHHNLEGIKELRRN